MGKSLTAIRKRKLSTRTTKPPYYNVILLNDDFTTMEFVIQVLIIFFKMTNNKAKNVMLKIHEDGSAICGTYTIDIAKTLTSLVNNYAKKNLFPLKCIMEVK